METLERFIESIQANVQADKSNRNQKGVNREVNPHLQVSTPVSK